MNELENAQPPERRPGEILFEGGEQETVEILPEVDRLTQAEREQGVVARVGRDRVERRVREGALPEAGVTSVDRAREDSLTDATYRIAGYFTMLIAFIALAIVVGWLCSVVAGV
jgi:hypothetical protein